MTSIALYVIFTYVQEMNQKILFTWDILGMSNYFILALKCPLFNSLMVRKSIVHVN